MHTCGILNVVFQHIYLVESSNCFLQSCPCDESCSFFQFTHCDGSRYRGTRQLSQPKRSYKQQHPQSTPSPMSQSHRQQQQQQLSQSSGGGGGGNRSGSGGDTLIVYHLDDFPTPFAKRLGGGDITLSDFKEKVFLRKGDYRSVSVLCPLYV